MGTYVHTLRAQTKTINGHEIAHYDFAYKMWNGYNAPADFNRMVGKMEAAGTRAMEKLKEKGIRLVTNNSPKDLTKYPDSGLVIYALKTDRFTLPSAFVEEIPLSAFEPVGSMFKRNGRFEIKWDNGAEANRRNG